MNVVAVPAAGPATSVELPDDPALALAVLQKHVGGWLQLVYDDQVGVYLHEEGKLLGLPVNARATMLAHGRRLIDARDVIVGDVVIVGPPGPRGEDTAPPAWLISEWFAL